MTAEPRPDLARAAPRRVPPHLRRSTDRHRAAWRAVVPLAPAALLVACGGDGSVTGADAVEPGDAAALEVRERSAAFVRLPGDTPDSNGNTADANCTGRYPDASAALELVERPGSTDVAIRIAGAMPDMLYTAWLQLRGTTDDGVRFGGNPLTGRGSTPMAPSGALPGLLAATGEGAGTPTSANGVITDANGDALLELELDFPIDDGAYPYQKFAEFDPGDPRYGADAPAAHPVAIVNPATGDVDAPFMIRLVSHCSDRLAHGLTPANREPWFDLHGL